MGQTIMATAYKVLGQSSPSAETNTSLYTVPASTQSIASTLVICNRGVNFEKYRIAVRVNGEAISNKNYIAYDTEIRPNDSMNITIGLTLSAGDIVSVYSSSDLLSFSLYGSEIS